MSTKLFNACLLIAILFAVTALAEPAPFEIAAAHSLQKIRRDGADLHQFDFSPRINLQAARDEAESFQLIVIPHQQDLTDVAVTAAPLTGPGAPIDLTWRRVDYVKTANPSYQVEYVGWWPDPLMPPSSFNVPADRVQPLWFTVNAPADAAPGVYRGSVTIQAATHTIHVPVTLRVRNFTLPRPGALATPFGLYLFSITEWYFGEGNPRDQLPLDVFAQWCEFLGSYRLTPKNIGYEYIDRTLDGATLPDKGANTGNQLALADSLDTLTVDMTALEQTVGALAPKYFADYSYGLYRLPNAKTFTNVPEDELAPMDVDRVLQAAQVHFDQWNRHGFPKQVYVYGMDEPVGDEVFNFIKNTYDRVKQAFPTTKIMQTLGGTAPNLVGLVDIWCPKTTAAWNPFYAERRQDGDTLWTYTCISPIPPAANFFIDEPAVDHRVLFWQTRQVGATGFLYWSTTWYRAFQARPAAGVPCFPDVPLDFSEHNLYYGNWVHVNGDGLLVYPGKDLTPIPSIRLEVIRDGIEDYEYLALLESLIERIKQIPKYQTREGSTLVARAAQLARVPKTISQNVNTYTKDPDVIFARRTEVANMIEQLQDILQNQDYKKWRREAVD